MIIFHTVRGQLVASLSSPVMENICMKLLWDFTIQTDPHMPHNWSDMLCISNQHSTAFLIDVAVPPRAEHCC